MSENLIWDPLMIQRYNHAGPRYTSYPTAIEFAPSQHSSDESAALSAPADGPLSLYIHIPFCSHVCYYCGCNKIVTKDKSRSEPYLALLIEEINRKAELVNSSRIVEQMHLGGGTRTFLTNDQLTTLINHLRSRFHFSDSADADYSIEIDPRELEPNTLQQLRTLGFNRVSFGVQDLDTKVQAAVNRIQPENMIRDVMDKARSLGFRSINIDLIYGLPHQTRETFSNTLDSIIDMRPDRLSIFNYAHLPQRFMPQRRINAEDLPEASEKLAIFGMAIQRLNEAGYHYIGMDHFALPDDELSIAQKNGRLHRNFQGYTTHGNCDLIGLGVSSISQLGTLFTQNHTDMETWVNAIESNELPTAKQCRANADDLIRRTMIMGLLCHLTVNFDDIDRQFDIDSRKYFADDLNRLNNMVTDGLVSISKKSVSITDAGRLMVRQACMAFDTYRLNNDQNRFSKAI